MGRRLRLCMIAVAVVTALSGCTTQAAPSVVSTTSSNVIAPTSASSGLLVELLTPPQGTTSTTLIVLIPGGGWSTADPTGMRPLAAFLADNGYVSAITTYGAAESGRHFPGQAEDVACAVAAAARAASEAGHTPVDIVVVGHSAGAHLAALVALRSEDFADACSDPPVTPDHLVGLAGPYDIAMAGDAAAGLFASYPPPAPELEDANPERSTDRRPELDALLVHGDADRTVPMVFTDQFADALERGGHDVTVVRPVGVDHHGVYSAEVAGPAIIAWLDR